MRRSAGRTWSSLRRPFSAHSMGFRDCERRPPPSRGNRWCADSAPSCSRWEYPERPEEVDYLFRPGQAAEIAVDDDAVKAMVCKGEQITEQPGEEFHRTLLYTGGETSVGRKTIKRGSG